MPCHVTGRIRLVLARPSPRSTWWFGDLREDVLNGGDLPETMDPTEKVGEISDWENNHKIFVLFLVRPRRKGCLFHSTFFFGDFFPSSNPCFWRTSCPMRCEVGAFFALSGYVAVPFLVQMGR